MRKNIIALSLLALAFSVSGVDFNSVNHVKQNNSNSFDNANAPIVDTNSNQTISDKILEDIGGDKDIIEIPQVVAPETPHKDTYTITFMNADGKILSSEEWEYGETPSYYDTPTLASNDKYRYEFKGWAPEIKEVTTNTIYVAQYKEIKLFDVDVYDGTRLIDSFKQDYKESEIDFHEDRYNREDTDKYTYTFSGYEEEISPVDGDEIYHATYEEKLKTYTVNYFDEDSTLIKSEELQYGSLPVFPVEELELSENERLSSIVDDYNEPIHYVRESVNYYAKTERVNYVTLNFTINGDSKSVTLPTQEDNLFTFPHFLNHNVYYTLANDNQVTINQNETYIIDQNYTFNVHFEDTNSSPIIKTSKNSDGKVVLEAMEYQENLPFSISLPTYVLDEETLSLLPVEVLGNGKNYVFKSPQYNEKDLLSLLPIPTTYSTIKTNAFANLSLGVSFNIPENVTNIEPKAFNDNEKTKLYFLNSEENLGFAEILDEYKLLELHFNEGLEFYSSIDNDIAPSYFHLKMKPNNELVLLKVLVNDASALDHISIKDSYFFNQEFYSITEIAPYAFSDLTNITSVEISQKVNKFGKGAFQNMINLKEVNIPYAITSIPDSCFENCSSLDNVTLHDGIKNIGSYAFKNTSLQNQTTYYLNYQEEISGSLVRLPAFVESIGDHAFENVNNNTFLLPKYLNTLGQKVFNNSYPLILFEHKDAGEIENFDNDLGVFDDNQVRWNIRETNRVISDFQK